MEAHGEVFQAEAITRACTSRFKKALAREAGSAADGPRRARGSSRSAVCASIRYSLVNRLAVICPKVAPLTMNSWRISSTATKNPVRPSRPNSSKSISPSQSALTNQSPLKVSSTGCVSSSWGDPRGEDAKLDLHLPGLAQGQDSDAPVPLVQKDLGLAVRPGSRYEAVEARAIDPGDGAQAAIGRRGHCCQVRTAVRLQFQQR